MKNLEAYKRNASRAHSLYGLSDKKFEKLARKQALRTQQEQNALHRTDSKDAIRLDLKDDDGKLITVTREDCTGDGTQIDKARARNLARVQNVWLNGIKRSKGPLAMATALGAFTHTDGMTPGHVPSLNVASVIGR